MTCRGADQIMLMYVARSMNLWASTDMRLTISPTVEDFLAALVITRACGTKEPASAWSHVLLLTSPGHHWGIQQESQAQCSLSEQSPGGRPQRESTC